MKFSQLILLIGLVCGVSQTAMAIIEAGEICEDSPEYRDFKASPVQKGDILVFQDARGERTDLEPDDEWQISFTTFTDHAVGRNKYPVGSKLTGAVPQGKVGTLNAGDQFEVLVHLHPEPDSSHDSKLIIRHIASRGLFTVYCFDSGEKGRPCNYDNFLWENTSDGIWLVSNCPIRILSAIDPAAHLLKLIFLSKPNTPREKPRSYLVPLPINFLEICKTLYNLITSFVSQALFDEGLILTS